jgi:tRNA/rRNA methyltransferase
MEAVILVEPQIPENTGFIARLCSNYNAEMRIVNSEFNLSESRDTAANAQNVLDEAEIFEKLENAVEDLDFVVGTKPGCGTGLQNFQPRSNTSLVLGREDSGLSNEELEICDAVVHIDTPGYSSMNLSHAAAVLMHEFAEESEGENIGGRSEYLKDLVGDNIISELILRGSPTEKEFDRLIGELQRFKNS